MCHQPSSEANSAQREAFVIGRPRNAPEKGGWSEPIGPDDPRRSSTCRLQDASRQACELRTFFS